MKKDTLELPYSGNIDKMATPQFPNPEVMMEKHVKGVCHVHSGFFLKKNKKSDRQGTAR